MILDFNKLITTTMKKLLLIAPIILLAGCITTTTGGEHVGYITASETNGIFFKGDVVYVKTDLQTSQEDDYCVADKTTFQGLKDANVSSSKVKIVYHSEFFNLNLCENIIDSFEIIK